MPNDDNSKLRNRRKVHILTPEEVSSGRKTRWEELEITGFTKNLSGNLWTLKHLTSLYLDGNQLTRISSEICNLTNLYKLDLSHNKLRSLPAEIGRLIKLRELHLNNNILRVLPYEIGKLFHLQILALTGNPLNQDILSLARKGTPRLLHFFLDNLAMTTPQPPDREWIYVSSPEQNPQNAVFSVMSYNVLCDKYATRSLYGYCPPWALAWEYRRKSILREINYYSADILALQEVETCQYHEFFVTELKRLGYEGIFNPKSRAKHLPEDEKKHVDGCAIFWKTAKFTLRAEHLVEFNQVAMQNNEGSKDMLNRVMTKDNIGIAALLETNDGLYENSSNYHTMPEKQLVLAVNAHMHWDPEFSDVKLIQTVMLCYELKRICEESTQSFRPSGRSSTALNDSHKMPLVLCGDFNSLPDSGVVEFLQTGKVSASHPDFKDIKYSKCLSAFGNGLRANGSVQMDSKNVTHPFKLNSCYNENNLEKLRYTNITYEFKGIIDYIFYSRSQLNCLGVLSGIDQSWFEQNMVVGCPHPHIPSDHISLVTEFQLLPNGYQNSQPNSSNPNVNNNFVGNQHTQFSTHHHQFSRYFNNPQSSSTSYSNTSASNGTQQTSGQRYTTTSANSGASSSRPGSANMLSNQSPINITNGAATSMTHPLAGSISLNSRR